MDEPDDKYKAPAAPQETSSSPGEKRAASSATEAAKLPAALLFVVGLWGTVAPYFSTAAGYHIPVPPQVEFVDHVVPGVVILLTALIWIVTGRLPLIGALAVTLAGFWMTMTHLLTVRDAFRGLISVPAALLHTTPGVAILILGGAGSVKAYKAMPD